MKILVVGEVEEKVEEILKGIKTRKIRIAYDLKKLEMDYDVIIICNDVESEEKELLKEMIISGKILKKSIFFLTDLNNFDFIDKDFLYKNISFKEKDKDIVIKELKKFVLINQEIYVKKRISEELLKLNYNFSYVGTRYLAESIYLLYFNLGKGDNLKNNIYPIIAKKYDKDVNNIKCNIINATKNMYYDCEEKVLIEYFGVYTIVRPTPKMIMKEIIAKI